MYPGEIPMPNLPTSTGKAASGRPKRTIQPVVLRQPKTPEGFDYTAEDPAAVKRATDSYLKKGQMPPGLQPKRSRPLQNNTNKNISRGWNHPRGRQ
jgi:hypothetical protein